MKDRINSAADVAGSSTAGPAVMASAAERRELATGAGRTRWATAPAMFNPNPRVRPAILKDVLITAIGRVRTACTSCMGNGAGPPARFP